MRELATIPRLTRAIALSVAPGRRGQAAPIRVRSGRDVRQADSEHAGHSVRAVPRHVPDGAVADRRRPGIHSRLEPRGNLELPEGRRAQVDVGRGDVVRFVMA